MARARAVVDGWCGDTLSVVVWIGGLVCWDFRVPEIDVLSRGELIVLVGRLFGEVQDLTRVNAELLAANAALTDRVARLERIVSRNSRNSGTPPSKDDDLGRTPPADVTGAVSGDLPRRRGKRKGAPGAHLAWSQDPNETLDHFPQGSAGVGRTWPAPRTWVSMPRISRSRSR